MVLQIEKIDGRNDKKSESFFLSFENQLWKNKKVGKKSIFVGDINGPLQKKSHVTVGVVKCECVVMVLGWKLTDGLFKVKHSEGILASKGI